MKYSNSYRNILIFILSISNFYSYLCYTDTIGILKEPLELKKLRTSSRTAKAFSHPKGNNYLMLRSPELYS